MDGESYKVNEWGEKQREEWVKEVETGLENAERAEERAYADEEGRAKEEVRTEEEALGETLESGEKARIETLKKIGRAANIAVEMEELEAEVKNEVEQNENPNGGYEKLMEGREELGEGLERELAGE